MKLSHPPVVDHLAASHGVLEMDLPVVLGVDVAQRGGNPALGHDRVRLAEQRLADDSDTHTSRGRFDRGAQAGAAGADHEHVCRQGLVVLAQKITLGSWITPAIKSRI